jgi:hypothetical protein
MKIKSMKEYYEYLNEEGRKEETKAKLKKNGERYFLLGKVIAQMANKSVERTRKHLAA